jgi:hypothetical protein
LVSSEAAISDQTEAQTTVPTAIIHRNITDKSTGGRTGA